MRKREVRSREVRDRDARRGEKRVEGEEKRERQG